MTALAAAFLAGLAVALATTGPLRSRSCRRTPHPRDHPWPVGLAGAVAVGIVADGSSLVLGLVGVAAATGGWAFVRRRRAERVAGARAERLVEMCEALGAELGAGQPPGSALRKACDGWAELSPVVSAAELGADVPEALRRAARVPGLQGMADLASAWQVSMTSGAAMSAVVTRVADSARRRRATSRLVASELAAARATAVLVALLPVGVLAMGSGLGGDPVGFLLSTPVGLACLAAGVALALVGLFWIEHIAGSVSS